MMEFRLGLLGDDVEHDLHYMALSTIPIDLLYSQPVRIIMEIDALKKKLIEAYMKDLVDLKLHLKVVK